MRGLAIATLFLGIALIDPGPDFDRQACWYFIRGIVFFVALVAIWLGV